jgi:hypothetical protein
VIADPFCVRPRQRDIPEKQPVQHLLTRAFFPKLLIHPADILIKPVPTLILRYA